MKKFLAICVLIFAFALLSSDKQTVPVTYQSGMTERGIHKITCGNMMGTAFVVSPNIMYTAGHVVKLSPTCSFVGRNNRSVSLSVVSVDTINDFAILRSRETLRDAFPVNCDGAIPEQMYTIAGYPFGLEFVSVPAKAINLHYTANGGAVHMRAMRSETRQGMSGGPTINASNEVVGYLIGTVETGTKDTVIKEMRDLPVCSKFTK